MLSHVGAARKRFLIKGRLAKGRGGGKGGTRPFCTAADARVARREIVEATEATVLAFATLEIAPLSGYQTSIASK